MIAQASPLQQYGVKSNLFGRTPILPVSKSLSAAARPQRTLRSGNSTVCRSKCSETRPEAVGSKVASRVIALLASGLICLSSLPAPSEARATVSEVGDVLVGPPRVIDGDTLVVANERIRLFGLDAPESKQSCQDSKGQPYDCGVVAAEALRKKIGSGSLQCQVKAKDLYSRNVSSCSLPGTGDIGDWLVKNGHAVAYRQYSKEYTQDEEEAKNAHRGIWQGKFEIPAEWRKENKGNKTNTGGSKSQGSLADIPKPSKKADVASAENGCSIKGNISGKGERIYHVPGGRYYDAVKIEQFKGEKFFCSEKEAEQDGFRKSRE